MMSLKVSPFSGTCLIRPLLLTGPLLSWHGLVGGPRLLAGGLDIIGGCALDLLLCYVKAGSTACSRQGC